MALVEGVGSGRNGRKFPAPEDHFRRQGSAEAYMKFTTLLLVRLPNAAGSVHEGLEFSGGEDAVDRFTQMSGRLVAIIRHKLEPYRWRRPEP